MSDKDNISDDDNALWDYLTRDVTPIKRQKPIADNAPKATPEKRTTKTAPQKHAQRISAPPPPSKPGARASIASDLDARTNDRLRKGQIPIDARIDLHGMNQLDARTNLTRFLQIAHTRAQRCVLVITGKGQKNRDPLAPATGILKTKTADWLREPPLNTIILKSHPAKPKDGGNGALYVLLRRQR
jgi:DNA-nicking Smr family endonuclease